MIELPGELRVFSPPPGFAVGLDGGVFFRGAISTQLSGDGAGMPVDLPGNVGNFFARVMKLSYGFPFVCSKLLVWHSWSSEKK